MVILGNIIKTVLELTEKIIPDSSPVKDQKDILEKILKKAKDTAFGREFSFEQILAADNIGEAFSTRVPYFDYDTMHKNWWKHQMQGTPDVTWPGLPGYYALSAGTTGKESKHIPVTDDMLEAIRKTSMMQILALANFDLPADFFEKEIMMLGSTTSLIPHDTYQEGEISGIAARNIPQWFESYYRPGHEIAAISDWDQKVGAIAAEAKNWDIGAMAGIPSWNELMIKKILEYNNAQHIHQVWPNLRVFASGGIPFSPYKKTFDSLLDRPIIVIDTYLASEGFIAYQSRPNEQMAMALSTNSGLYFEFVPFLDQYIDEVGSVKQGAPSLTIDQVEEGMDYIMIISSVSGAWRYMIGDTIRITDKHKAEIIITGRTKHYLNVVGSQLSVMQMNLAMKYLEGQFNVLIPEFTVAAVLKEEGYIHHWYLGMEGQVSQAQLIETLDDFLQEENKSYKSAREKALKRVQVSTVSPDVFYAWNEQEQKKGGQVKMPRVMKEEEFARWESFVNERAR